MDPFSFDKKLFLILLFAMKVANAIFYYNLLVIIMGMKPITALQLSLLWYFLFLPLVVCFPAAIIAPFLTRTTPYKTRFDRCFWLGLFGVNTLLLLLMVAILIKEGIVGGE